ncbi:MAG: hypothetical protein NT029_12180 [Armatimonadetes bacterium]|nr:hypothetical protein [Armatimonadota bacterium]
MTPREAFKRAVTHGGPPVCSPQIGGGAGFDTKLAGKRSVWETALEDTLAAVARFDILPLINVGIPDFGECSPQLRWMLSDESREGERTFRTERLETPTGTLTRTMMQEPSGGYFTKYALEAPEELNALAWYVDAALDADLTRVTEYVRSVVATVGDAAAVDVQWPMQPYELLCFPSTKDTALLVHDCPEQARRIMERIVELDARIIDAVAAGGADFVFLGGPAKEMISPAYYRNYLVPFSKQVTDIAHERGLLIYSHICSPIEPFLTLGFYNQMGIDLFETLSPPPVGNVVSMADALTKLDPAICTRGNVGLDLLLQGSTDDVRRATATVLEETRGRMHMVAASDYLLYDVPEENVHAMAAVVREWAG